MRIIIEGYDPVDRQLVRGELAGVDRAQTQAADIVTLQFDAAPADNSASSGGGDGAAAAPPAAPPANVVIKQNPTLLQKARPGDVRVGACVWDGGFILSAILEHRARSGALRLAGARCVELGAGCGLAGLVAARLGASVMLTDQKEVLVHARGNAAKNKALWMPAPPGPAPRGPQQQQAQQQRQQAQDAGPPPPGSAGVMPLDWAAADMAEAAAAVRRAMGGRIDVLIGSDCIYPDPAGCKANAEAFIEACVALCDADTVALITYEVRIPEVREALLGAARARFNLRLLAAEEVPDGWRSERVETFEMRLL
ncbi:hypothetical protein Rsub_13080 [Raphidocelis subcapitata]|uniref:Uncharacterized protein n=1 Tax=Raphidocelis subcapitata TaxID=307507 RepID=A0A2V0PRY9_9CHLO|nr:hypothetical protein Rsub_13080 [Raphidocelis subcapitata]|eukprot:GBG00348.1 hypothetical protein Rsub_13080 [Raphidocelis subcapitata]